MGKDMKVFLTQKTGNQQNPPTNAEEEQTQKQQHSYRGMQCVRRGKESFLSARFSGLEMALQGRQRRDEGEL